MLRRLQKCHTPKTTKNMEGLHAHVLGGGVAVAPGFRHRIFFLIADAVGNPLRVNPACHTAIIAQQVTYTRTRATSRRIRFELPPVSPKMLHVEGVAACYPRQATQPDSTTITADWVLFPRAHEKHPQRLNWRGYKAGRRESPRRVAKATTC